MDARIIQNLYAIAEKHEAEISAIIMMAKGLFTTVKLALGNIEKDIKEFSSKFKHVREMEMAAKKEAEANGEPEVEEAVYPA